MPNKVWNLQLFAEDAGVESAVDTDSTPNDTVVEVSGGDAQSEVVDKVSDTPEVTENPETENEVSFDDLIKGDYKEDFDKKVQDIVRKRVKKYRGIEEQLDQANASIGTLRPMMLALAQKYGLDINDPNIDENVVNAVMHDKAMYEQAAMEANMDVDTYMEVQELKRKNLEDAEKIQAYEHDKQMQEQYEQHLLEEAELKKKYPDFDLIKEIKNNQDFAYLIDLGVPVENAYIATNYEKIEAINAEAIASKASEKVANTVKANKKRPAENGLESQPGSQIGTNIKGLSKEQLDDLEARARRGESIDLKDFSIQ